MSRSIERSLALIIFICVSPIFLFLIFLIKLSSEGPAIFWSDRFGKDSVIFSMPKFRTMLIETPQKATHLLDDPDKYLTSVGKFLRKTSLDELPQLISVISGHMSFVGPRPSLFNQSDLQGLRKELNIDTLMPGVTGWAQVNGRDEISIQEKIKFEKEYLERKSLSFDLYIIGLTFLKVFKSEGVSH